MSSTFGNKLKISVFGQSHAPAVGVVIDGFPSGFEPDMTEFRKFMERRAPGRNAQSTPRHEDDSVEFLSGFAGEFTCGAPIAALIRNSNTRSGDYASVCDIPRPSHADYPALLKFGEHNDFSGGGHFSGRLTAPLCVAGALSLQLLSLNGITVTARVTEIGGASESEDAMTAAIDSARAEGDSVGGVVECVVSGAPAGIGDPMFGGMENRISAAVFAIPAVRGIEFGLGFEAARLRGSEHNDAYTVSDGKICTESNNHGGVIGGITTGMPIVFRVAFKPTPSIARAQQSVSISEGRTVALEIKGRHDPCIVRRAVPCVESACAVALLDALLEDGYPLAIE